MNNGEQKMTNLLLEDFINEINAKRQPAIQEYFDSRMKYVNRNISENSNYVKDWNNDNLNNLKCELTENGFITEIDKRSWREIRDTEEKRSYTDTVCFLDLIFNKEYIIVDNLSPEGEVSQYYSSATHMRYTFKNIEDIKKVVLDNTTTEINNVFDMYLLRVTSTVSKIDYCSKVISCITKTFSINGYPNSTIDIKTENGTSCQIKTTLKWNRSKFDLVFGQYPTTIHNVARDNSDKKGDIFEVASDNYNIIWSEFKAHEKNDKTFAKIAKLKAELKDFERGFYFADGEMRNYNERYAAHQIKRVNKRIEKLNSEIIDVKSFRDIGQSLIKEVA